MIEITVATIFLYLLFGFFYVWVVSRYAYYKDHECFAIWLFWAFHLVKHICIGLYMLMIWMGKSFWFVITKS